MWSACNLITSCLTCCTSPFISGKTKTKFVKKRKIRVQKQREHLVRPFPSKQRRAQRQTTSSFENRQKCKRHHSSSDSAFSSQSSSSSSSSSSGGGNSNHHGATGMTNGVNLICADMPPFITSYSPMEGTPGTVVHLFGTNLCVTNVTVAFAPAQFFNPNNTSATVIIPPHLAPQRTHIALSTTFGTTNVIFTVTGSNKPNEQPFI